MEPGPHGDVAWPTQQLHENFRKNSDLSGADLVNEKKEWAFVEPLEMNMENRTQKIFTNSSQYRKRSMP